MVRTGPSREGPAVQVGSAHDAAAHGLSQPAGDAADASRLFAPL